MQKNNAFCFLNIFKPVGMTSFDVIYKLRKRFNIKKIGHSGTLDPLAEGVLQVAVGTATRLIEFLGSDKKYVARILFGYTSETGDREGKITPADPPSFTYDELLAAINSLTGEIEQVPPIYSAIKVGGKKLCDIARRQNVSSMPAARNEQPGISFKPSLAQNDTHTQKTCFSGHKTDSDGTETENFICSPQKKCANESSKIHAGNSEIEIPKRIVNIYEAKLLKIAAISGGQNTQTPKAAQTAEMPETAQTPKAPKPPQAGITPYTPETAIAALIAETAQTGKTAQVLEIFEKQGKSVSEFLKNPSAGQITEIEIEISCSKGTYIRSFAADLGAKLDTGAYLTALKRTHAGNFDIKDSVTIDEADLQRDGIKPHLALDLPAYTLNDEQYKRVLNGMPVMLPNDGAKPLLPNNVTLPNGGAKAPFLNNDGLPGNEAKTPLPSSNALLGSNVSSGNEAKTTLPSESPCMQGGKEVMLLYKENLVSIGKQEDNRITVKKVFKDAYSV